MKISGHDIDRAQTLSETDWLAARRKYIGSSDAAALFDHGYSFMPSAWSLWADKTGKSPRPEDDDDEGRATWGQMLEPIILEVVAQRTGWDVLRPLHDRMGGARHDDRLFIPAPKIKNMACTCDAFVLSHEDGLGLIEAKNRDFLQWRDNYTDDDAAIRDKIQLAHQFVCVPEAKWGCVAVLVGGNDLKVYTYTPDDLRYIMVDIVVQCGRMAKIIAGDLPEPSLTDDRDLPKWLRVHAEERNPLKKLCTVAEDKEPAFDKACDEFFGLDWRAKAYAKITKRARAAVIGDGDMCDAVGSSKWHVTISYSNKKESRVELPEPIRAKLLEAAHELEDIGSSDLSIACIAAAGWFKVTRKASITTKVEVTPKDGYKPGDILAKMQEDTPDNIGA